LAGKIAGRATTRVKERKSSLKKTRETEVLTGNAREETRRV